MAIHYRDIMGVLLLMLVATGESCAVSGLRAELYWLGFRNRGKKFSLRTT
ncbi:hypothetical protein KC19_2G206100 [Ceratodon purpureus]|uniref:Uncharacterized protein n=1 Tax=Ceratodon purpureus TaxID=3225 RepID=A0A8T0J017_CERPU|nr:hypothetical protein KC19_2G206100 [Ceratodon purpureus]